MSDDERSTEVIVGTQVRTKLLQLLLVATHRQRRRRVVAGNAQMRILLKIGEELLLRQSDGGHSSVLRRVRVDCASSEESQSHRLFQRHRSSRVGSCDFSGGVSDGAAGVNPQARSWSTSAT